MIYVLTFPTIVYSVGLDKKKFNAEYICLEFGNLIVYLLFGTLLIHLTRRGGGKLF